MINKKKLQIALEVIELFKKDEPYHAEQIYLNIVPTDDDIIDWINFQLNTYEDGNSFRLIK